MVARLETTRDQNSGLQMGCHVEMKTGRCSEERKGQRRATDLGHEMESRWEISTATRLVGRMDRCSEMLTDFH
jgi:hypothetical protein